MLDDGEFNLRERFTRWAKQGENHHTNGAKGWGPAASATCTGERSDGEGGARQGHDWSRWPAAEVEAVESL